MRAAIKRFVWAGCLGLTILAVGGSPLYAETSKERRERMAQEKKAKDEAKAQERAAAKQQAEAERQEKAEFAKAMKEASTPKKVKLESQGLEYTTSPYWQSGNTNAKYAGVVEGAKYLDPSTKYEKKDSGPKPPGNSFFIRVLPAEQGKTMDDVVAALTKELNCCGPHFAAKPEKDITIDGETAKSIVMAPNQPNFISKHYLAALQRGEKMYVFHLTSTEMKYTSGRAATDKMLKSVKWLDEKVPQAGTPEATAAAAEPEEKKEAASAPADAPAPAAPAAPAANSGDGLD